MTDAGTDEATDIDAEESATNRKPSHPRIVADAVRHALFSAEPRRRYLVGTRWEGNRVIDALMERLIDANESPSRQDLPTTLSDRLERKLPDRGRPSDRRWPTSE